MSEIKEYSGYWWLPENPERKIPGILKIEDKKNSLELLETFDDSSTNDYWLNDSSKKYLSIPFIFGVVEKDTPITLSQCSYKRISPFHKGNLPTLLNGGFLKVSLQRTQYSFISTVGKLKIHCSSR